MRDRELRKLQIRHFAEKLQPIYEVLDWRWDDIGVPTVAHLETAIEDIIEKLKSSTGNDFVYNQGLVAEYKYLGGMVMLICELRIPGIEID